MSIVFIFERQKMGSPELYESWEQEEDAKQKNLEKKVNETGMSIDEVHQTQQEQINKIHEMEAKDTSQEQLPDLDNLPYGDERMQSPEYNVVNSLDEQGDKTPFTRDTLPKNRRNALEEGDPDVTSRFLDAWLSDKMNLAAAASSPIFLGMPQDKQRSDLLDEGKEIIDEREERLS